MQIDRNIFMSEYKNKSEIFGSLAKVKTDGINLLLDSCQKYCALFFQETLLQQVAYVCATVHHETAGTYEAYKEVRQIKTDTPRRKEVKRLQDRYWNTGYYGRGPVQLTWAFNYKWAQELTGAPLLNDPDLLLTDLPLGYEVCIKGMTMGKFTGKSLNAYINSTGIDYLHARKIVNGMDCADLIAGYAKEFEKLLRSAT